MALFALGDAAPHVHPGAWVHHSAQVIGDVTLHDGVTVWPGAVLRGDFGTITVGAGTVVEDNCVLHAGHDNPLVLGEDCILGHLVHIEGCTVEDAVLIGSGSSVNPRAIVRTGGLVAAGAVLPPGFEVPAGERAQGVPARLVANPLDPERVREGARQYRANASRWQRELVRIDEGVTS